MPAWHRAKTRCARLFELIFGHPGTTSAIIGTINPVHLAHNVRTAAAVLAQSKN